MALWAAAATCRKGFDLRLKALAHLREDKADLHLVVFGQLAPHKPLDLGFPIHYTGHLHDDLSLRALYSAADLLIVPSRQEAFGQTASEAHACGTPVVAFNTGGLPDIIDHKRSGYLAEAFDVADLAHGIKWVLTAENYSELSANSRNKVLQNFDSSLVARKYIQLYQDVLAGDI